MRHPSRPASPAPDGPGDHDHATLVHAPAGPTYLDLGLGRAGFGPDDQCPVDELCALMRDHGGGCDSRPEPARWRSLGYLLGRGLEGPALAAAVERAGADALRLARS